MWQQSKDLARAFKRELAVYRRVLADERTPRSAKIFLGVAVGYLCMPFDLIPDFIPVLGHLDDVVIVRALVYVALRFIPPELVAEHRTHVTQKQSGDQLLVQPRQPSNQSLEPTAGRRDAHI